MSKVRERILDVATQLFYQRGIQSVGVDAIISKADVARMSFYRHFKSKEGLVVACLMRRDAAIRAWFEAEVERLAPNPKARPLAVFDALAKRFATEHYRGCGFINTMSEIPDRADAAHRSAAQHKHRFQDYLAGLLRAAGLAEAHAPDLMLLFDGATVAAVRTGTDAPAFSAKRMAAALLGLPVPRAAKRGGAVRRRAGAA
jgi:AcrR family transcriptional regulator